MKSAEELSAIANAAAGIPPAVEPDIVEEPAPMSEPAEPMTSGDLAGVQ